MKKRVYNKSFNNQISVNAKIQIFLQVQKNS